MASLLLFLFTGELRRDKEQMNLDNMIDRDIKKGVRAAQNEKKRSTKCRCGCIVWYKDFNKFGWGVCPRCGSKVMKKKDAFKDKLMKAMKGD